MRSRLAYLALLPLCGVGYLDVQRDYVRCRRFRLVLVASCPGVASCDSGVQGDPCASDTAQRPWATLHICHVCVWSPPGRVCSTRRLERQCSTMASFPLYCVKLFLCDDIILNSCVIDSGAHRAFSASSIPPVMPWATSYLTPLLW